MASSGPTPRASIRNSVWKAFSRDSRRTRWLSAPGNPGLHPPEEADHLQGGLGRLGSLVSRLRPGPLDRLLHRVGGENTEGDRDPRVQHHLGYPLGDLGAEVVEMGGSTAD